MKEKRIRKKNDINVKDIDDSVFDYVKSTGIPMNTFVKMALDEKIERDKKKK